MPIYRKFSVVILGFDGALASAISGALDIFSFAGVTWQRIHKQTPEPRFDVKIASLHKRDIHCSNRLLLKPHIDLLDCTHVDLLLIPTIGGKVDDVINNNRSLPALIAKLYSQGADIASNCSGAFLLAESGILNHCKATTHWGYGEEFSERYPEVDLCINELITQSDNIFCAGGGVAFYDLCVLLIERYCGHEVANQVAKAHVINRQSDFQATYSNLLSYKEHQHKQLMQIQAYIETHFTDPITTQVLANYAQCTVRTLHRLFQRHLQMTPVRYLQFVRIENAKRILEHADISVKSLASEVGYDDTASFCRLFKRLTGFTPAKYRTNFKRLYR